MHQLLLPLTTEKRTEIDTFFVDKTNQEAWSWIEAWPEWPGHGALLYGPCGCGKSYLAKLWQKKTRAHIWSITQDVGVLFESLKPHLLVNNFTEHLRQRESAEQLLAAYNITREKKGSCLLVGTPPLFSPERDLPDLTSRLKTLLTLEIKVPSDHLLHKVIENLFHAHQATVSPEVISFLTRRIERAMGLARKLANRLATESLRHQRPITIDFVKSVCPTLFF